MTQNNPEAKRDEQVAETPIERDGLGRFRKGGPPGPGAPKRKKSYRELIPKVCKKVVDILNEKDDTWIREMKRSNPAQLLTWTTQILRTAEMLNQTGTDAAGHISAQVAAMSEEQVNAAMLNATKGIRQDFGYFDSNERLQGIVDSQGQRIAKLEAELVRLGAESPTVVIENPEPVTLPAPDDSDEPKQLPEPDEDFERMLTLDEDDPDYRNVWQ